MLGHDCSWPPPAANKMLKSINFSLTEIQSSCLRPLGLRLMMTEEEETKRISIRGTLRHLQVYPKCVTGGKCEGTSVRVTSADKMAMFLLLSVKEIRRFYRTLRGQTRPRFLSL